MTAPPAATDRNARLAELLGCVALADQRAFEEVYRLTSSHLYAVALRIVRDRSTAEEILQEVYVSIWHRAGSYAADKSQPTTWLTAIVRHRCLDLLRRRELDTVTMTSDDDDAPDFDLPADGPSPSDLLVSGADAAAVRGCVDTLEGAQKQAIALAFFQGLSHGELAAHLRQPLGTVKSWIRRGLEKLKDCLDRAGMTR